MSSPRTVLQPGPVVAAMILALAGSVLWFLASPSPAGAVGPQGQLQMDMPLGSSGKALTRQGVTVSPVQPTTRSKGPGGSFLFQSPVLNVTFSGEPRVTLRGGLIFKRKVKGKVRQVKLTSLAYEFSGGRGLVKASHGGKRVSMFQPLGTRSVNYEVGTVDLPSQAFELTRQGAGLIKKSLRLKKLPAAQLGTLELASQAAFEDPYAELCDLPATTKTAGDIPPPGPLPDLEPSVPTSGDPVTWGFKASYRGYIFGAGGFFPDGGATVNPAPFPGPPSGFTFPFDAGVLGGAGPLPEAIINGSGEITSCHTGQFRLTMSDPTVYVDSEESRIVMTIDTNVSGNWIPDQRVDFATLDTTQVDPVQEGGVFTWNAVPAALTAEGSAALRLCNPMAPPPCLYGEGSPLDPITVRARVPVG